MPAAAAAWVATAFLSAAPGLGIVAAGLVGWAAYGVTVLGISAALAKVSNALAGKPRGMAGMRSREMIIRSTTEARSIVYGEVRTGGVLAFVGTIGSKNEYFDAVITLAGHQVESITDVYFDNELIANADINGGNAAGGVVGGSNQYAGKVWIYKYLGTGTQTASAVLTADYPSEWTTDHTGKGVAYIHVRCRRDQDLFPQGPPTDITTVVKGAKVYDPRKDTTVGGSGSHRYTDATTWEYSNNPALCIADYVTGGTLVNTTATPVNLRGFGAAPTLVDWSSVITAANECDETVTIPPTSPATTQARYKCDGVLSSGNVLADNLEDLLTSMVGQLTHTNGQYKLFAGAYDTPTLTLNESDLAGGVEFATAAPRSARYNAVKGTRWDTATGQTVEFLPKTSATYESQDGGARLYRDIELPFTLDEYRAQRIAQLYLARSRMDQTLIWRGNLGCLRVGVWETVEVTCAELNLSSKVFRCVARDFRPASDGNEAVVELTLREESSAVYTDPIAADYGDLSPAVDPGNTGGYLYDPNNMSLIYDPQFEFGEDGGDLQYWTHTDQVTYQDTDVAQIVFDGSQVVLRTYYNPNASGVIHLQVKGKWGVAINVRYRVTSALSGPDQTLKVQMLASRKNYNGVNYDLCGTLALDLSACVVGDWYEQAALLPYEASYPPAEPARDYALIRVYASGSDITAGTLELDYLYATRQAATVDKSSNVGGSVPYKATAASGQFLSDYGTWLSPTAPVDSADIGTTYATLQDAVDAAGAGGGALHMRAGTYNFSQIVIPAGRGLTIFGDGPDKTKLVHTGASSGVVLGADDIQMLTLRDLGLEPSASTTVLLDWSHASYGASNFRLQNLELNQSASGNTSVCMMRIKGGSDATKQKHYFCVTGMKVYGGGIGVDIDGNGNGWANDHRFIGLQIQGCASHGLRVDDSFGNFFAASIENCGNGTTSWNYRLDGISDRNTFVGRIENTTGDTSRQTYSNNSSGVQNLTSVDYSGNWTNYNDLAEGGSFTGVGIEFSSLIHRWSGDLRPFRSSTDQHWLRTWKYDDNNGSYGRFGITIKGDHTWADGANPGAWAVTMSYDATNARLSVDRPFQASMLDLPEGNGAPGALAGVSRVFLDGTDSNRLKIINSAGVSSTVGTTESHGRFTGTISSGLTTTPTGNIYWTKVGVTVTLRWGQIIGTKSGGGALTLTGLPAALIPAIQQSFTIPIRYDHIDAVPSSTNAQGSMVISPTGDILIYGSTSQASFTAGSYTCGLILTPTVTYNIEDQT